MSGITGWYYLTNNGNVNFQEETGGIAATLEATAAVRWYWPYDPGDRVTQWRIAVEALALGAKPQTIQALAQTWGLNNLDSQEYAYRVGADVSFVGGNYVATPQATGPNDPRAGIGDSGLEALARLAQNLLFTNPGPWNRSFEALLFVAGETQDDQ